MYVSGIDYPVFLANLLTAGGEDQNAILKENDLVWLVGCLNGAKGNQVKNLNQWWVLNSNFDYIIKDDGQNFPPTEIC